MGNETQSVNDVAFSWNGAKIEVNKMKSNYGNGVATKCVVWNNTQGTLYYLAKDSFSGRFDTNPPVAIAAGAFGIWLHCKKDGTACGSIGYVCYGLDSKTYPEVKFYLGWDTPYSGKNSAGIEILLPEQKPDDLEAIGCQTQDEDHYQPKDLPFSAKISVTQNATSFPDWKINQKKK
eukprot:536727_1